MENKLKKILTFTLIILFMSTLTGCGYKGDPVYVGEKKEAQTK